MEIISVENSIKTIYYAERVHYPSIWSFCMNFPTCFRMFCVLSGTLVLEVDGRTLYCEPNSALIIPPQTLHKMIPNNTQTIEVIEVLFELNDEGYVRDLNSAGMKPPLDDVALHCIRQVSAFMNSKDPRLRGHAYGFLDAALSQICILAKVFTPYTINSQLIDMDGFSNVTKSIIIYVDTHFAEQFTLNKMGKDLNFNQSYLCAVFKRDTGITINEYLNLVRISHFIKLFFSEKCNDKCIGVICRYCGFLNVAHFNRTFKKFLGTSPTQYKRQHFSH